ncbi:MAG: glycosyltransferase [bacterium]
MLSILKELGYNVRVFKINRKYFIKVILAIIFPLILPILSFRKDRIIIISSVYGSFYFFTIPAIIYSKILGIPLILFFKGGKIIISIKKIPFVKHIFKIVDRIIVPGDFLKNVFNKYKISSFIIPDIIDTSYLKVNINFAKGKYFLMTRALEKIYGIDLAIKAYHGAYKRLDNKNLVITGSGRERKNIENLIKNLNLKDQVILKGECSAEEIGNLLYNAFALLNTSYYDNYPNSILEAFYAKVPVLTTDAGGIPYIVKDKLNGILFKSNKYNDIANEMIKMVKNKEKFYKIIDKAKEDLKKLMLYPNENKTKSIISKLIEKGSLLITL